MDEPIIDGNCGELCGYHCCRGYDGDEDLGMYLLPLEYEMVQEKLKVPYERHTSKDYELMNLKKQYYIFCTNDSGCLREFRPIQCRTYPIEPHLVNGTLQLIVEKTQLHECPLINKRELWRDEYIDGIYQGWTLLLTIKPIRKYIESISNKRGDNVSYRVK